MMTTDAFEHLLLRAAKQVLPDFQGPIEIRALSQNIDRAFVPTDVLHVSFLDGKGRLVVLRVQHPGFVGISFNIKSRGRVAA
jgi:hypothetical protein